MSTNTDERKRIIEQVNRNWSELIGILERFSKEELETPNVIGIWSLKDLIGHLETWDRIAIKKLDNAERGIEQNWWEVDDHPYASVDEFNEADADSNRHKPIPQLREELHVAHGELLEKLEKSPATTAELVREDTYDHYAVHLNDIRHWQSSRAQE
ncbi:MAG: maleylpyruvate isomerase N-terminal domain-containing protein [Thermomicrobiaceae bacterium]